ncbi:hypothetical protein FQR65_LT18555 [Abscondita terminalis]|nr:hypothetical protein FQR65_LT18555 [Abscondita terminalis]
MLQKPEDYKELMPESLKTFEVKDNGFNFELNGMPKIDINTFSIAIDLLENTSTPSVNIYSENVEELWNSFSASFKNIEAAGGVVLNTSNEVFLSPQSKWDLPKGKMEKGESREVTALREVEEECSVTALSLERFLSSTYHMYTKEMAANTESYTLVHHAPPWQSQTAAPEDRRYY